MRILRFSVLLIVFMMTTSFSTVSAQDSEKKDKEFKKTHVQVVIHRLLPNNIGETFEFYYDPRELRAPYKLRLYGTVDQLMSEYIICSNGLGDVSVLIGRRSKDRYVISIAISDKLQSFPELETWTYFNSLKEREEILRTQMSPDSNKTYQISVAVTRYYAYQGGAVLQCNKNIFPLDSRSRPN